MTIAFVHSCLFPKARKVYPDANDVLRDLCRPSKTLHYMWYAFPLEYDPTLTNVSKMNRMCQVKSVDGFLADPRRRQYYLRALGILSTHPNVAGFFGPVDSDKFRLHLGFFRHHLDATKYASIAQLLRQVETRMTMKGT